jgi:hypothetical protein
MVVTISVKLDIHMTNSSLNKSSHQFQRIQEILRKNVRVFVFIRIFLLNVRY